MAFVTLEDTYGAVECVFFPKTYEKFKDCEIEEFYSDSKSDTPMAEISKKAFLVDGNKIYIWN